MGAARKQTPGQAWAELQKNGLQLTKPGKRGPSLITALKRYLADNPEYLEQIIMGMVHKARMGDHKVLEMIWDRIVKPATSRLSATVAACSAPCQT